MYVYKWFRDEIFDKSIQHKKRFGYVLFGRFLGEFNSYLNNNGHRADACQVNLEITSSKRETKIKSLVLCDAVFRYKNIDDISINVVTELEYVLKYLASNNMYSMDKEMKKKWKVYKRFFDFLGDDHKLIFRLFVLIDSTLEDYFKDKYTFRLRIDIHNLVQFLMNVFFGHFKSDSNQLEGVH